MINKALKLRIYPTPEQQVQINKTLGSCRALFNMMLYERKQAYEQFKDDKIKLYTYKYKTEKEYKQLHVWMQDVDSQALQQSRINLSNAYSNFFKGLSGKYKQKYGFPKFQKKKIGSSYRTMMTNNNIKIDFLKSKVKLPKLDWIDFKDLRTNINGIIKSATVSRSASGKYFVSLLLEQELELRGVELSDELKTKTIGLDASMESFFVDNNGNSPAYERLYRKYEPLLKKAQRKLSKKKLGSKSWYKSLLKVNLIHEKIKNRRKDFTQKLSTELVRNNDVIVVEHLSLKGMSQVLNLGKSVMDLGYSEFVRQLNYKCLWNNKTLIQADRWFASSKTCSICGYINRELELSDRKWNCPNCGIEHDRDQNAGINLKNYGIKELNSTEFVTLGLGESNVKAYGDWNAQGSIYEVGKSGSDARRSTVFSR